MNSLLYVALNESGFNISFVLSYGIQGREVARALKDVATEEDYLNLIKSKTISNNDAASRLPLRPDLFYKELWTDWDDFLTPI